jgi:hypothetical protein
MEYVSKKMVGMSLFRDAGIAKNGYWYSGYRKNWDRDSIGKRGL